MLLPSKLTRLGPEGVHSDPGRLELLRHAEDAHGHPVLGHGVGRVVLEPAGTHVQRRGDVQDVRVVLGSAEVGQRQLGAERKKDRYKKLRSFNLAPT